MSKEPPSRKLIEDKKSPEKTGQGLTNLDFVHRLRSAFKGKTELTVGSLNIIGLNKAQEKFGKKWPKVKDRVHETVRTILHERTAATDIFSQISDTSYIICFAELDKMTAQIKGALIAEEIAARIFGNEETENVIEVTTVIIDTSSELASKKISKEGLLQQIAATKTNEPVVHEVGETPATPLADDRRDIPKAAPSENATRARGPSGNRDELERLPKPWFVYRPAWLVKSQMIIAHTCTPVAIGHDGFLRYDGASLFANFPDTYSNLNERKTVDQDIMAIQTVVRDLTPLEDQGRSPIILVPVHIETVSNIRRREIYLDCLRRVPESFRKMIQFELFNISEQTPNSLLKDVFSSLKPYSRGINIRFCQCVPRFDNLVGLDIHAISVDISDFPTNNAGLIRNMELFVKSASSRKIRALAHGVKDLTLLTAAISSGFFYIDGPVIGSPVEIPGKKKPLDLADILQNPVLAIRN